MMSEEGSETDEGIGQKYFPCVGFAGDGGVGEGGVESPVEGTKVVPPDPIAEDFGASFSEAEEVDGKEAGGGEKGEITEGRHDTRRACIGEPGETQAGSHTAEEKEEDSLLFCSHCARTYCIGLANKLHDLFNVAGIAGDEWLSYFDESVFFIPLNDSSVIDWYKGSTCMCPKTIV
jgi:hypothetical protein